METTTAVSRLAMLMVAVALVLALAAVGRGLTIPGSGASDRWATVRDHGPQAHVGTMHHPALPGGNRADR